MELLIGTALIILISFILFCIGVITGLSIVQAKEEMKDER